MGLERNQWWAINLHFHKRFQPSTCLTERALCKANYLNNMKSSSLCRSHTSYCRDRIYSLWIVGRITFPSFLPGSWERNLTWTHLLSSSCKQNWVCCNKASSSVNLNINPPTGAIGESWNKKNSVFLKVFKGSLTSGTFESYHLRKCKAYKHEENIPKWKQKVSLL